MQITELSLSGAFDIDIGTDLCFGPMTDCNCGCECECTCICNCEISDAESQSADLGWDKWEGPGYSTWDFNRYAEDFSYPHS